MRNSKGQFVKGFPHNKGVIRNESWREKQRIVQTGKKLSEETKKKIGLAHLGVKRPPEVGMKISLKKIGKARFDLRGKNHPFWIKDRSKVVGRHNRNFHDPEYKQWCMGVKNRDGWKCRLSNSDCSGRLEGHHILGWKEHSKLRYQINNGIALCHAHHPRKRAEEKRLIPTFLELVSVSKVTYR